MDLSRRSFLMATGAAGITGLPGCVGMGKAGGCPVGSKERSFACDHNTAVIQNHLVKRKLRFSVIADVHYTLIDDRDADYRKNAARVAQYAGSDECFDKAIDSAKKWGSEILILPGDLISFPSQANVEHALSKVRNTGLDWIYTAGNHDWHFEGVPGTDNEQRAKWIERLKPLYRGANPMMSSEIVGGVRMVTIDNSTYRIFPEQLSFLRAELAKGDPTCLFMHIPLYLPLRPVLYTLGNPDWGEASDNYYGYEKRLKWDKDGQPRESFELRELVFSAPNVVGVFTGHLHILQTGVVNGVPQFVVPRNLGTGDSLNVELRA